ncbi:MAG: flagellar FliJ family protein [Oscillospiraceae bacterium]|jgi:flagellar FliJ protein|nr:flagellar FliJ family protein [Oscillospiraceae bacterium]
MKKFTFSLDKLKAYKERMLDAEKNNLGILRRELVELQGQLQEINDVIELKNTELAETYVKGTTPVDISVRKRFIASRKQDAVTKQNEIVNKENEIQKQLEVVLELQKEVSSLEKLEEAQLEEYRALELKETELFIDEFITNADFRKGQKNSGERAD